MIRKAHENPPPPSAAPTKREFAQGDPLLLPGSNKLQSNPQAVKETQQYTIVWHYLDDISGESAEAGEIETSQGRGRATLDGSQIRGLEVGDLVSVWGRTRFMNWSNHVEHVSMRVFWAV